MTALTHDTDYNAIEPPSGDVSGVHDAVTTVAGSADYLPPQPDAFHHLSNLTGLTQFLEWIEDRMDAFKKMISDTLKSIFESSGLDSEVAGEWVNNITLGILLVTVLVLVILALRFMSQRMVNDTQVKGRIITNEEGEIVLSPVEIHLRHAQTFLKEGNPVEAIHHGYLASLSLFDESGWIPYQPYTTNLEYLKAIRRLPDSNKDWVRPLPHNNPKTLYQGFQTISRTFEEIHFGNYPPNPDSISQVLTTVTTWMHASPRASSRSKETGDES